MHTTISKRKSLGHDIYNYLPEISVQAKIDHYLAEKLMMNLEMDTTMLIPIDAVEE